MDSENWSEMAVGSINREKFAAWLMELYVISESLEFVATLLPEQYSGLAGVLRLIQRRLLEELRFGDQAFNS